jgi:NAD(P)-dependent dehydrogenase (short-subunit alcohol dehydrogenase family)
MPSVLITGCSTGFGRAAAVGLTREGWTVIATVRREADARDLTAAATGPGALHAICCDVTVADDVGRLGREAAAIAPALDGLVNNAGTAYPGPLELLPIEDLRSQLDVNIVGQLAVTQAVLPLLRQARGTIVNVSSIGGRRATPMLGAYNASKFALEGMSDALRMELAPFGVRVVVVEPGSSRTAIWRTSVGRADALTADVRAGDYARLTDVMRRMAASVEADGFPPEAFADLVRHILTTRRPKTRYPLGPGVGRAIAINRWLPDRLRDWLIRRRLRW